ncbi:MAG: sugar phosphate nucleotidyltransferase [Desulfopila sp.]
MQAMILAAGYGTRLLPFTRHRPKPLFPVLNIPLLHLIIARLQAAGFDHIIVNCHHLGHQISTSLAGIKGVSIQEEDCILGTGGALRRALSRLRDEPLLVTNGDIYHTIDFDALYQAHLQSDGVATLAVHDCPRFNSLLVEGDQLQGITSYASGAALAFTGVHVIDPQVLRPIAKDQQSCIIERYRQLLKQHRTIVVQRVDDAGGGTFWTDIGTPADYLELHGGLLQGKIPRWPELAGHLAGPVLQDHRAGVGAGLQCLDWACIGNATIGENVSLRRCVVWDGAVIADNSSIQDEIVTRFR